MKKTLLVLASLLLSVVSGVSQNTANLVIFSEDGDPFYAYVNGVKHNATPETNVKITGLMGNLSIKIQFENQSLPQLKQAMVLEPGFEHTARIKRDMKQQLKLRYFGKVPLDGNVYDNTTTTYNTAESNDGFNTATDDNSTNNQNLNTNTSIYTNSTNNGEKAVVSINAGGVGVTIDVNQTGMNSDIKTTSTTTVSSYSSSQSSSNSRATQNVNTQYSDPAPQRNCTGAMSDASFAKMRESVESKPFSDTKMSTARVATKNACLSVRQIKQICSLFSMDDDRLTYAKFAYDYCVDKANYYQVSEVFSFSSTTDELNQFLER